MTRREVPVPGAAVPGGQPGAQRGETPGGGEPRTPQGRTLPGRGPGAPQGGTPPGGEPAGGTGADPGSGHGADPDAAGLPNPGHPDDAIPFRRHLGIQVVQAAAGRALLRLPARPEIGNRFGNVHGGALATLVDGAMSNAILSLLPAGDRIGGTIELSIRFLEPARGTVMAEGRVLRLGGRIAFAQADVRDGAGRLVATAQGSYALHRHRAPERSGPAPGRPDQAGRRWA
ncbi:PaaI family thioesterase [Thermaerobacter sp. PB12/4term]|uniref:PaaI family thioesterase n=1 Tax=Thermaerobacter sp. PB12/4term TaxID=2293838 RepID=UPI000E3250FE|nr:PaaI family thioesterase [Thermaerobacter sp. PB12/4term]QIA27348.1 PaaI family thioesterase [Thermaerobacter sp. PB12/4term]